MIFHSSQLERLVPMNKISCFLIVFAVSAFLLSGSAHNLLADGPVIEKVDMGNIPHLLDDSAQKNLKTCLEKSLVTLEDAGASKQVVLCGRSYSSQWLARTLTVFLDGMKTWKNEADFHNFLTENFDLCQVRGSDDDGSVLVTGYYEPIFLGSLTRTPPFVYPLYQIPQDLIVHDGKQGDRREGRRQDGRIVPYWSREEIEKRNLLQGQEIVYLADPVEVFILHVQGSGRIRLPDGSECRVHYAGSNGREYRSIGRLLADRGIMPLAEVTLPKIVSYLRNHPEDLQEILNHNKRYIFFSLSYPANGGNREDGPAGSMGQTLTAGRSVALDSSLFPLPMVGYLETQLPIFDQKGHPTGWKSLHRFVVNQDTGAAIKGPGRVDLFLGGDVYAAKAAGVMKQPGTLYFLLLKEGKLKKSAGRPESQ